MSGLQLFVYLIADIDTDYAMPHSFLLLGQPLLQSHRLQALVVGE